MVANFIFFSEPRIGMAGRVIPYIMYSGNDNIHIIFRQTDGKQVKLSGVCSRLFSLCCPGITEIDMLGINTAEVTDMRSMFAGCKKLRCLKNFDEVYTHQVSDMHQLCSECTTLEAVDLSNSDTNNVITTIEMFRNCT